MRRRVAAKLTYANVLSTLAMFLVLGGGAYAATTLPDNSVGTDQIQRNGVTKPDVAPDAIGTAELKDGSVRTKNVANGSLECKDFKPSADACGQDTTGPAGLTTTIARSHTETIELTCNTTYDSFMNFYSTSCQGSETVRAECAPGEVATGGSVQGEERASDNGYTLTTAASEDRPDPADGTPTAWAAEVTSSGYAFSGSDPNPPPPSDQDLAVYVVCAS
jgi:hypothetical protein